MDTPRPNSEEYEAELSKQPYRCLICGLPFERLHKGRETRPHCDHDHKTGRIRGFLCVRCNSGLGMFRDNTVLLQRAILYLSGRLWSQQTGVFLPQGQTHPTDSIPASTVWHIIDLLKDSDGEKKKAKDKKQVRKVAPSA